MDCKANISGGEGGCYTGMNIQFILYIKGRTWCISPVHNSTRNMPSLRSFTHSWSGCLSCDLHFIWMHFAHLAMDVTPACEHCRTSISNVLWRNPISGFNGSSQATHPGSHEIYAHVKLVYSISFHIFNYCHYCSACHRFPAQNGINKLWVDQKWGQLRSLHIRWWGLHLRGAKQSISLCRKKAGAAFHVLGFYFVIL